MDTPRQRWSEDAAEAIRALGNRPLTLYLTLLLLNAAALPYAGFAHDARLYGVQVLNRLEPQAFGDDLFFRYGSQDDYSLFSAVVAPLAAVLGLPWTFFLLYLLCNALLLYALQRLVETLIEDRLASTLALLFLAVSPLGFGGFGIFNVNEPFLTPRIAANALVLLALERAYRGKHAVAVGLTLLAATLHPIMAAGGLGVVLVWWGWEVLPRRLATLLVAGGGLTALIVPASPPVAFVLFGQMDREWLEHVRRASPYNFPLEWATKDWINVALTIAVVYPAMALLRERNKRLMHFVAVVLIVAVAGVHATLASSLYGYRLLFQAQPYRALALLKCLQAPLTFWLAVQAWKQDSEKMRLTAVALLGSLCVTNWMPLEFLLPLLVFPVMVCAARGLDEKPWRPDWLSHALAASLAAGFVGWSVFKLALLLIFRDLLCSEADGLEIYRNLLGVMGPLSWLLLTAAVLVRLKRSSMSPRVRHCLVLGGCLALQFTVFLLPGSSWFRQHFHRYEQDTAFIADYLEARHSHRRVPPTIYWSSGQIEVMWLELGVKSYYERLQIQGVLFSRQTAIEGERRARVVAAFEMARLRRARLMITERWQYLFEQLYATSLDCPPPTRADLARLCREEAVDYVIVENCYPGLYSATNGRFYIYDCRQVRAALSPRAPAGTASAPVLQAAVPPSTP